MRPKEIALELVISPKTVANHIQRVLGKLGAHSSAEAVAIAYREGFDKRSSVSLTGDDGEVRAHLNAAPTVPTFALAASPQTKGPKTSSA